MSIKLRSNIALATALIAASAITVTSFQAFAGSCSSSSKGTEAYAKDAPKDIVDTAIAAGSFNTLVAAVQKAGLVETLKGKGPFTVFAPTDAAFAKLPEGTVEGLLANPEQLKKILTYHAVAGKVMAEDVVGLSSANSVAGMPIRISVKDGSVFLNGSSKVIKTDVGTKNGVIHVIDQVILPN